MSSNEALVERLRRSVDLFDELIAQLPESVLMQKLPGLPSNSVGAQLWCVVGARESYARAIAAGEWFGFSCSLSGEGAKSLREVTHALAKSGADVLQVVASAAGGTAAESEARTRFALDLIEHEAAHQGQLIRYLYGLRLPIPAGWKARYSLD